MVVERMSVGVIRRSDSIPERRQDGAGAVEDFSGRSDFTRRVMGFKYPTRSGEPSTSSTPQDKVRERPAGQGHPAATEGLTIVDIVELNHDDQG